MPATKPIATRVPGPIQLFSMASLRKYDSPTSTATMPTRFSHWLPMRVSSETSVFGEGTGEVNCGSRKAGGTAGGRDLSHGGQWFWLPAFHARRRALFCFTFDGNTGPQQLLEAEHSSRELRHLLSQLLQFFGLLGIRHAVAPMAGLTIRESQNPGKALESVGKYPHGGRWHEIPYRISNVQHEETSRVHSHHATGGRGLAQERRSGGHGARFSHAYHGGRVRQ